MSLKHSIMIKSSFGSKSPSKYILNYTSREEATESLEIENYITKYTTRLSANESLRESFSNENDVEKNEQKLTNKEGIMFGSQGLSYSYAMLKDDRYSRHSLYYNMIWPHKSMGVYTNKCILCPLANAYISINTYSLLIHGKPYSFHSYTGYNVWFFAKF